MNHFFLSETQFLGEQVRFPPQIVHQIIHVLRMKNGDQVIVLDGQGYEYRVKLSIDHDHMVVGGDILQKDLSDREPKTKLSLCFGLTNREKVELILQKGTEIGVSAFYPFMSSRTLVQTTDLSEKKIKRWEKIIKEAAEQAGRGRLPVLNPPLSIRACCAQVVPKHQLNLAAWEEAAPCKASLSDLISRFSGDSISLFVGGGGTGKAECHDNCCTSGVNIVSLGKRILRMETAAFIFPALILHDLGEM